MKKPRIHTHTHTHTHTVNFSVFDFNCNVKNLFVIFGLNLALLEINYLPSQIDRRPEVTIIDVIFGDTIFAK
jgi:hypothetical protein